MGSFSFSTPDMIAAPVIIWLVLWALLLITRAVAHATRDKVYNLENTRAFKAAKRKWDSVS